MSCASGRATSGILLTSRKWLLAGPMSSMSESMSLRVSESMSLCSVMSESMSQ